MLKFSKKKKKKKIAYVPIEYKGLFGFVISITHNSKYVGPTIEKFVWFLFPSLNSLIFE